MLRMLFHQRKFTYEYEKEIFAIIKIFLLLKKNSIMFTFFSMIWNEYKTTACHVSGNKPQTILAGRALSRMRK